MNTTQEKVIGQLVAEDYRAASVFKKYGIDFCCKGDRTISQVCEKKQLDKNQLIEELEAATSTNTSGDIDFKTWPLDLLADYIEKTHHRYVEAKIPELKAYLKKINHVHGGRHPELAEVEEAFNASASELSAHMKKEELILFPFIRKMMRSSITNTPIEKAHFGTVENPIEMMKHEHEVEGERFARIAEITNNYTPPEDACNTYRVAFALLNEFETDLHRHIHLENNILFPKAIDLEHRL